MLVILATQQTPVSNMAHCNQINKDQLITLADIYNKLSTLDHIENKLDNLHNNVEGLDERIAALECNDDHNTGHLDTVRAVIQGVKQTINSEVQNWLEILENKDGQLNIKLLNLAANPWETTENLQTKTHEVLSHISHFPAAHIHEMRRLGCDEMRSDSSRCNLVNLR